MIAVIGLGYVGLPVAVALAEAGHSVVAFDRDTDVTQQLAEGTSHLPEVPDERLARQLPQRLLVTSSAAELQGCTAFLICVPTPLTAEGEPDLSCIAAAVESIAPVLSSGNLVVLESTSYPGTTEEVVAETLARRCGMSPGTDFCVAFSPERIDPGNETYGLASTPKIVAGLASCCTEKAANLYASICPDLVVASGVREAEMAKLLENTYRQVNIALMNELAKLSHELGIDLHESIRLASTKPFGFQPFYPGPGVGGHCIPIDPHFLAARIDDQLGKKFQFVELAREINASMPAYVVSRITQELELRGASIKGSRILVLGITYKRDVPDMREAPSETIVELLREAGADVAYSDPLVPSWTVRGTPVSSRPWGSDVTGAFDASILITDHSVFDTLDAETLGCVCLDTRGRLTGANVVRL